MNLFTNGKQKLPKPINAVNKPVYKLSHCLMLQQTRAQEDDKQVNKNIATTLIKLSDCKAKQMSQLVKVQSVLMVFFRR